MPAYFWKKLNLNLKVLLFPNEVSIVLEQELFLEIIGIKASHCVRLLSHTGHRSALCAIHAICANYCYQMCIRNLSHIWNGGVLCHIESFCNFNGPICVLVYIREIWNSESIIKWFLCKWRPKIWVLIICL